MAERRPPTTNPPKRRTDGDFARRKHLMDAASGVLGYASPVTTSARRWSVTVEIEGVTTPRTFPRLSAALDALWESLRALPLGFDQYDAARHVLGPGEVHRVEQALARDGELTHRITMNGQSHVVSVRTAAVDQ